MWDGPESDVGLRRQVAGAAELGFRRGLGDGGRGAGDHLIGDGVDDTGVQDAVGGGWRALVTGLREGGKFKQQSGRIVAGKSHFTMNAFLLDKRTAHRTAHLCLVLGISLVGRLRQLPLDALGGQS